MSPWRVYESTFTWVYYHLFLDINTWTQWSSSELFPGFIYVIGGISDEGMELRSSEVYDPISHRWSALPVMVTRRAYVGVACLNNCIYAVGGWNEALGALETVEKYCPEEVKLGKWYRSIKTLEWIKF